MSDFTYSELQPVYRSLGAFEEQVNDVTDFGAKCDGVTDDTKAIQDAFNAYVVNRRPVLVPGLSVISQTLEIPLINGFTVRGHGGHYSINPNQDLRGMSSGLVWAGADGGTMVRSRGAQMIWDSLPLFGQAWSSISPNPNDGAAIKFLLSKDVSENTSGIGTGKTTFINWLDGESGIALQAGTELDVNNSDVVSFVGNTYFYGTDTGLKVLNEQGMGFCFQQVHANCPVVFEFVEGGGLDVQSAIITSSDTTAVLKLSNPKSNNGHYRFGTIKRDANSTNAKIVEMTSDLAQAMIDIGHLQIGGGSASTAGIFVIKGRSNLNLRGCNRIKADTFILDDSNWGEPNVLIERTRLDYDDSTETLVDTTNSGSNYHLRFENCFDDNWVPVTDANEP